MFFYFFLDFGIKLPYITAEEYRERIIRMKPNIKILISIKDKFNIPYPLLARDVGISQTSLYKIMAYEFEPSTKQEKLIDKFIEKQKVVAQT
jgi:hypothetical protein